MQTLVLDAGFRAIAREPWETAIVKVIIDRVAEVVEEYPDDYIGTTAAWKIKRPSVIRLLTPIKRKRAIKFSRQNIWARDGGRCQYCGNKVARHEYTYDHVLPRSKGGLTTWTNVVVSCVPCNQYKGGRTPEQAGMRLLSQPVKPKKLPDTTSFSMMYHEGMPESWKSYLMSSVYWNLDLEK